MSLESINSFDHIRLSFNATTSKEERSQIGQFLTPASIADFMSSLIQVGSRKVRILDPGAGAGVLFAACVNKLVSQKKRPLSIEVVAYETDRFILPHLQETLDRCTALCASLNVRFSGIVREDDFIASAISETEESLFAVPGDRFTHAILNPPYKKINGDTNARSMLYSAGLEVANLYAAFVWLSMRLLEPGGQIIAITPRSFCNGPYFKKFRVAFLDTMSLRQIHVFASRNKAFSDDNVLQENIIYSAIRETEKPKQVIISASDNDDFENSIRLNSSYDQVVHPSDSDCFIHLGVDETAISVAHYMKCFNSSLDALKIGVSTGRVVDFRAKKYLQLMPKKGSVPLIYPCHFHDGFIRWPLTSGRKPNAIISSKETTELLMEEGYYVLVKRFSSKEQKRRVMAAVYDPSLIDTPFVGFENHINYFHSNGKGLSPQIAKGLALYLNSTIVDKYFRLYSGHTQVNTADLRRLPYPTRKQLIRLGKYVQKRMPNQKTVDNIIDKVFENATVKGEYTWKDE